ncbi:transketolase [Chitinophaga qingshengii]|uniref:Transketolase n=1 Tax=Chitinophaga qingshengii TaxID=1569794 RepID=A0ABR7TP01_9BACT|nr:transketolase [Chitinophaga qingshengii]MBC9932206.1 transketolase [Chitinophaga qingshengii]
MKAMTIEEKCIDTIRCLAMDAVQKANSGHPGTPMALAPAAFVLWTEHLRYNPRKPDWFNRDRFVLSNGHASMLQYAVLHLTGYDISLDDIKAFRQWHSNTPGHPEYGLTPGIETTTGPLGQGIMTAVGMAMAEAHLAAIFNKEDMKIVDHYTYVFCSDGDLMEGASHEAASVAGHLGLGKLICLYDNNHITIEGNTSLTYSDDVAKRFEAYHWHVQDLGDQGNDLKAISAAFANAKAVTDKPSMILLRTHIGYGAPNKQDTPEAHGSPLGADEIKRTKEFYGWPADEDFLVPADVREYMKKIIEQGKDTEQSWNKLAEAYNNKYPGQYALLQQYIHQALPEGWDNDVPAYKPEDGPKATREVSSGFLNAVADKLPWLIGGSGDLEPSTLTLIKSSGYFSKEHYENRNLAWGIREHVMCAASSGLQLHGGVRPYAATFFIFTDYARPAIRLACIMELPVIYVMTHDSIGLGEDGTTHQPVEHLASLRAMPHLCVIRPADANEAAMAWRTAIARTKGPTMLVLTRQKLPISDRSKVGSARGLQHGAYILSKEKGNLPALILIATGSEVQLALEAQEHLWKNDIDARVVSMPSWELFSEQSEAYRQQVLPPAVKARVAIEAASPEGWEKWIGEKGVMIGLSHFGASAPAKELFKHYGFTVENILERSRKLLQHEKVDRV